MKTIISINRSGMRPSISPTPDPVVPDYPAIPEIAFAPDLPVPPFFDAYLVATTSAQQLELVSIDEAFSRSGDVGYFIFLCTTDTEDARIRSVHFVCRVLGFSRLGADAQGSPVATVYYQELMRPGQVPSLAYSNMRVVRCNLRFASVDNDALIFRPSCDRLYRYLSENDGYYLVSWQCEDNGADSAIRCRITSQEGAEISKYLVQCDRVSASQLTTDDQKLLGSGSLIMEALYATIGAVKCPVPANMFSLACVTNYSPGAWPAQLYWMSLFKNGGARVLQSNLWSEQDNGFKPTKLINSDEMLVLAPTVAQVDTVS